MIRAVSDAADANKDSSEVLAWRDYACDAAAAFTVAFLKTHPVDAVRGEITLGRAGYGTEQSFRDCLISFRTFIEERTHGFVGREFVFDAIQEFQSSPETTSGYFVVEGKPGIGKSAILAEYVKRNNPISHFNIRALGIVRTETFLRNVCAQLATRYYLGYSDIPDDALRDGRFLIRSLEEAARKITQDDRIVIAVDAMDEVDPHSQSGTANLLYLPESLPAKVFFVLTTRKLSGLQLVSTATRKSLNLGEREAEGRRDVCLYIERYTSRERLAKWLQHRGIPVEKFVEQLADKSENNFMYLRFVLPAIEDGEYRDMDIARLPDGLIAYYEDHWKRMEPLPDAKLKIIFILATVSKPVSTSLLARYIKGSPLEVQRTLDEWSESGFLTAHTVDGQKRYSLYHNSFREFLHRKDIGQEASVNLAEIAHLVIDELYGGCYKS